MPTYCTAMIIAVTYKVHREGGGLEGASLWEVGDEETSIRRKKKGTRKVSTASSHRRTESEAKARHDCLFKQTTSPPAGNGYQIRQL